MAYQPSSLPLTLFERFGGLQGLHQAGYIDPRDAIIRGAKPHLMPLVPPGAGRTLRPTTIPDFPTPLTPPGASLATPLPKYEGTILGPDAPPVLLTTQNFPGAQVAPVSQGVGSLPLATSGYQNPTPYSGVAPLSPAFISQAGQGTAAPSPSSGLAPLGAAFMNQFERAKLGLT